MYQDKRVPNIFEDSQRLIDQYQEFTSTTAIYPGAGTGSNEELMYLFLGLEGERQEWFDSNYDMKEAGDIFWYASQICSYFNTTLYLQMSLCKPDVGPAPVNAFEAMKKWIRDGKDIYVPLMQYVRWTLSYVMYRYHYSVNNPPLVETVEMILDMNREKLISRKSRGVLQGDGDAR
jgi:hypothetical protein